VIEKLAAKRKKKEEKKVTVISAKILHVTALKISLQC